jgi:sec-independent protein translocase protein TatA
MPGMGELLVILVIVLLIFGAGKLPQIGDSLGKSIRNFKKSASVDNELEVSKQKEITRGAGGEDESADAEVVRTRKSEKKS